MSIGVTGPWVGDEGLSPDTPVHEKITRIFTLSLYSHLS